LIKLRNKQVSLYGHSSGENINLEIRNLAENIIFP
jgi:hypothetical protein